MALTTYLISQASDHLTEKEVQLWLLLFRKSPKYQQYAYVYAEDLEAKILATEGTVKARMLNALLKEIDDLGVGEVSIRGDREGTHWNQTDERITLIEEGLDVLFDDISTLIVQGSGVVTGESVYMRGLVASGQRTVVLNCPVCNAPYWYTKGIQHCYC